MEQIQAATKLSAEEITDILTRREIKPSAATNPITREEQVFYCRQCLNRKASDKGLICSLTDEMATFQWKCADFKFDEKVESSKMYKQSNYTGPKDAGIGLLLSFISAVWFIIFWIKDMRLFMDAASSGALYLYSATGVSRLATEQIWNNMRMDWMWIPLLTGFIISFIGVFFKPRGASIAGLVISFIVFLFYINYKF